MRPLVLCVLLLTVCSKALGFCFERAAYYYRIDPVLLMAIAHVESGLNHRAVARNRNGTVDVGLMQVNSIWWRYLDRRKLFEDPCYNTLAGAWVLRICIERYGYTWDAVACYNTGRGLSEIRDPVLRKKALAYINRVWRSYQLLRSRLPSPRNSRT